MQSVAVQNIIVRYKQECVEQVNMPTCIQNEQIMWLWWNIVWAVPQETEQCKMYRKYKGDGENMGR